MNKTEIIKALNKQIEGQTVKSISLVIDTLLELITSELKANNTISFRGFLTIENRLVKGRSGDLAGHKWQTKDRLVPKAILREKFKKEVQNGK